MKQINLLPQQLQQRAAQQRVMPVYIASVVLAAALVGVLWFGAFQKQQGLEDELQQSQANAINRTSGAATDLDFVITPDLLQRVKQLNTLASKEVQWKSVFTLVNSLVSKESNITSLSIAQSSTAGVVVKLTGENPSSSSFADLVATLKQDGRLTSVKVDSYAYTPSTGRVSYTITLQFPLTLVLYSANPS